ncbi:MAG: hypothetical protein AB7W16_15630 [Candidatus Obscuribacterales bacterium]
MAKKSFPGRILVSREFDRREDADSFAKEYKAQYKEADLAIKFDISRTVAGRWTATLYVNV